MAESSQDYPRYISSPLSFGEGTGVRLIIQKYYPEANALRDILVTHSTMVARRALKICAAHPEMGMNPHFVKAAAMLHDIGICRCDAPGIQCFGTEPYIRHGIIGAEMLRHYAASLKGDLAASLMAIEPYARVCERHTGAGLTKEEIISQNLPLPHQDFLPETLEEKLICYADKFYSKTHPDSEKTLEQAERSLAKFGQEGLGRFMAWHELFEG